MDPPTQARILEAESVHILQVGADVGQVIVANNSSSCDQGLSQLQQATG